MSERECSQCERAAMRADQLALAPAGLSEERAECERECSQCERGSGPRRKRAALSSGPATRADQLALAPAGLSEERE